MTGQVIHDYFAAFSRNKIRLCLKTYNWFVYLYLLLLLPMSIMLPSAWQTDFKVENVVRIIAAGCLTLYVLLAAALHPVAMPKILYLCPFDRAWRKAYIRKAWLFKLAVPVAACAACMGVLGVFGKMELAAGIRTTVMTGLLAVATSAAEDTAVVGKSMDDGSRLSRGQMRAEVWDMQGNVWMKIASSILAPLTIFSAQNWHMSGMEQAIVAGCAPVVLVPLMTVVILRVLPRLEDAVDYESRNGGRS